MTLLRTLLLCCFVVLKGQCSLSETERPVIGVLLETTANPAEGGKYYMYSDYRFFLEQAGAGVVPVFVNQSDAYYDFLFSRLNGILLPGGGVDVVSSYYGQEAYRIYKAAVKMNDAGNHFPLLGICLGMEEMSTWPFGRQRSVLVNVTGTEDVSLPLNFTAEAATSRMYGRMPPEIRRILATENVTANFHHSSLALKTYQAYKELSSFYSVTSVNVDAAGLMFVSSMEARHYPFYGLQWHPEKNSYWFKRGNRLNHSRHAVLVTQYAADLFVSEARHSGQSFKSLDELSGFLINNYPATFDRKQLVESYYLNDSDVPAIPRNY